MGQHTGRGRVAQLVEQVTFNLGHRFESSRSPPDCQSETAPALRPGAFTLSPLQREVKEIDLNAHTLSDERHHTAVWPAIARKELTTMHHLAYFHMQPVANHVKEVHMAVTAVIAYVTELMSRKKLTLISGMA